MLLSSLIGGITIGLFSHSKMEQQSSFNMCLCVKVEACDTNKWVPHGKRCPGATQCYERDNLVLFCFIFSPFRMESGMERGRRKERGRERLKFPTEELGPSVYAHG